MRRRCPTVGVVTKSNLAPLHQRAHAACPDEVDVELAVREGEIPRELRGVLFRNGPGRQSAHGVPYSHPFDGDGMIFRFCFDDGKVRYRNRFVGTTFFQNEARAGKMLYRSFGTNLPGGLATNLLRTRFKNAANTSIVRHGGVLLALWEGGLPHAIADETLATLGPYDFEGRLRNRAGWLERAMAPHLPFSAHPRRCPDTGDLYGFGTAYGRKNRLFLYRVRPDGAMDEPEEIELPKLTFIHDFVLTPSYRVVFDLPASFDVGRALLGLVPPVEAITFRDEPTIVRLYPRDRRRPRLTFEVSGAFVFHFVNGFERDDGTIVIEGIRTSRFPTLPGARALATGEAFYPVPLLTRFVLDPRTGKAREETVSRIPCELPTVDPAEISRAHSLVFAIAGEEVSASTSVIAPYFSRIVRFDRRDGTARTVDLGDVLTGEPLYVPPARAGEDGFVLTLVYEGAREKSALYILSADDLRTRAVCDLPHGVPPGFHGTWVPS